MSAINVSGYTGTIGSLAVNNALTVGGKAVTSWIGAFNSSIAITPGSSVTNQNISSVVIGNNAGATNCGPNTTIVGVLAGQTSPGDGTCLYGIDAGNSNAQVGACCFGLQAGRVTCGANSICIGKYAGVTNCPANTIVMNATGVAVNPASAGVYITSIRGLTGTGRTVGTVEYNPTTSELTYIVS